ENVAPPFDDLSTVWNCSCSDNPLHSLSAPNTSNAGASEADLSETRAGHDDYP
ncbi:hypothetical protein F441_13080, partial [Phytophthora nicotianae CJ01A1]